jgi:hypothetical protein
LQQLVQAIHHQQVHHREITAVSVHLTLLTMVVGAAAVQVPLVETAQVQLVVMVEMGQRQQLQVSR